MVEHIKTVVNPLKGPKILGTIDLSLLQQPSASGKSDHRGGDASVVGNNIGKWFMVEI